MIADGMQFFDQWWMAAFPGLAIFLVVMAFNFIGDGIRDALDPRFAELTMTMHDVNSHLMQLINNQTCPTTQTLPPCKRAWPRSKSTCCSCPTRPTCTM